MTKDSALEIIKAYEQLLDKAREAAERHRTDDGERVHCLYTRKGKIHCGYYWMGTLYDESIEENFWEEVK